jgi:hypothetical protein
MKAEWGLFAWTREPMTRLVVGRVGIAAVTMAFLFAMIAGGQQKNQNSALTKFSNDPNREVSVQGSVVSYWETSSAAPFGAHVALQTSSGVLDVHLGDARLLESKELAFSAGDAVRVVGENVSIGSGTQFVARLVQRGNQVVLLRSQRGLPLRPVTKSADQRGAL